jgi:hypothetical protein
MTKRKILFSITTVIERPDKRKQVIRALRSIHKYEPNLRKHAKIVVVNEYSEEGAKADFLKDEFPWIDKVVNKTKKDKGQSGSLNLIIDMLGSPATKKRKYDYWIHWEESWVATKPFLKVCMEAMDMGIDQLQLTEDIWEEDHDYSINLKRSKRKIYVQRKHFPYKKFEKCLTSRSKSTSRRKKIIQDRECKDYAYDDWPLWSLRPSMDRVSKILNVGYFNTDPKFWPVHFELLFAAQWTMQPGGAVKAGILCTKRQKGHVSFSETNAK